MKLISSSLQLKKFTLLKFDFKVTHPPESKISIQEIFKDYETDVNFAWKKNASVYVVFCKVEINNKSVKKSGYSIFAEGIGFFEIEGAEITEDQKKSLVKFSGSSIVLQELRSLIRNNTLLGPLGAYVLPTVNITEQIKSKVEIAKAAKKQVLSKAKNK